MTTWPVGETSGIAADPKAVAVEPTGLPSVPKAAPLPLPVAGAVGVTGTSGGVGVVGATGTSGAVGVVGATGTSGAVGVVGATGTSGDVVPESPDSKFVKAAILASIWLSKTLN